MLQCVAGWELVSVPGLGEAPRLHCWGKEGDQGWIWGVQLGVDEAFVAGLRCSCFLEENLVWTLLEWQWQTAGNGGGFGYS